MPYRSAGSSSIGVSSLFTWRRRKIHFLKHSGFIWIRAMNNVPRNVLF
jgi:hypothetical protein